jgi:hypothetical protein
MRSRSTRKLLRLALAGLVLGPGPGWLSSAGAADLEGALRSGAVPPAQHDTADKTLFISTLQQSSTTCDRTDEVPETCRIEWTYVYAEASSGQYLVSMTTEIGGRVRAATQGFFQTSMYLPSGMYGPGLAVDCGQPGEGGYSDLGKAYVFSITARETGGGQANTTATVVCPYSLTIFSDGFESHTTSAWSAAVP